MLFPYMADSQQLLPFASSRFPSVPVVILWKATLLLVTFLNFILTANLHTIIGIGIQYLVVLFQLHLIEAKVSQVTLDCSLKSQVVKPLADSMDHGVLAL